jgi:ectoine hydroxylase-related dioxygenase (phytanoyl-CoA dioxygenase family)
MAALARRALCPLVRRTVATPACGFASGAIRTPSEIVTPAVRQSYLEDGVVCLRGAFEKRWIDALGAATDAAISQANNNDLEEYTRIGKEPGRFCAEMDCGRKYADFQHFLFESPAAEIAARVMGTSKGCFFYDILFVKEPGTPQRTVWHQDKGYWLVDGEDVCSIWLPLDPVPRASCLEFVRGTNRSCTEYAPFRFKDGSVYRGGESLPRVPDVEASRSSYDIVGWDMEPGDCLVFDFRMLHSAPPIASGAPRRRAFSTRWVGDGARFAKTTKCEQSLENGYPNYDCGLKDGDRLWQSPAFPILWPRDAPERPVYNGLEAERSASTLQLQPVRDFARVRLKQAQVYSVEQV